MDTFNNISESELGQISGGGQRLVNAVLSGAMAAVEGAETCSLGGPGIIALCAAGAFLYGGYWGYQFS